jgi:hypothetical protein
MNNDNCKVKLGEAKDTTSINGTKDSNKSNDLLESRVSPEVLNACKNEGSDSAELKKSEDSDSAKSNVSESEQPIKGLEIKIKDREIKIKDYEEKIKGHEKEIVKYEKEKKAIIKQYRPYEDAIKQFTKDSKTKSNTYDIVFTKHVGILKKINNISGLAMGSACCSCLNNNEDRENQYSKIFNNISVSDDMKLKYNYYYYGETPMKKKLGPINNKIKMKKIEIEKNDVMIFNINNKILVIEEKILVIEDEIKEKNLVIEENEIKEKIQAIILKENWDD